MSTRALLAVYVNGTLEKTYFHHWDGYLSHLGNILRTFTDIVELQLNNRDTIHGYNTMSKNMVKQTIKERYPIDLLTPLMESEGGFREKPNFSNYWCLEYLYRINFTFNPKETYQFWKADLQYTKEIKRVSNTWKEQKKFIPLIEYEGVHYITEHDIPISSILYNRVKPCIMPEQPKSLKQNNIT